jgi:competence protein ComEC
MQRKRKIIYSALFALTVLVIILAIVITSNRDASMRIVFLDVGQGDAILISEGSEQILIDGGKNGKLLLEKLGKYVPFWDRRIEAIIETHPDADHAGGLVEVAETYTIDSVFETKMESDSLVYKKLEDDYRKYGVKKNIAKRGMKITFANGAIAEFLYPFEDVRDMNGKDTNKYSVVVKLTVNNDTFLFTGDLPFEQEQELLASNVDVKANVLKVSHHGSKYASGDDFLSAVNPIDAIISVGKNNSYGHPNQEVLQRLSARRIRILRTDEVSDIVYECGNKIAKCALKSL